MPVLRKSHSKKVDCRISWKVLLESGRLRAWLYHDTFICVCVCVCMSVVCICVRSPMSVEFLAGEQERSVGKQ